MRKLLICLNIFFVTSAFVFVPAALASVIPQGPTDNNPGVATATISEPTEIKTYTDSVISAQHGQPNAQDLIGNVGLSYGLLPSIYVLIFGSKKLEGAGISSTGIVPSMGNAIAYMYSKPAATTQDYVADVMNTAGIASPAYAQGLGFASLSPILETWKTFRNVAYLFYVVLFLIIGFMVMFRQRISGQTVVTVQQALPRVVVSLIAVTFSYAIAGLMIDAMYIIMFLLIGLFTGVSGGGISISQLKTISIDQNIFQVFGNLLTSGGAFNSAYDAVANLVSTLVKTATPPGQNTQGLGEAAGFIGGIGFAVIFAIATLFSVVRLFIELIKTYVSIIISIALSPIALMLGAIPNNNALGSWIKSLIANLAVFPAVLLLLIIYFMLSGSAGGGQARFDGGFIPPYIALGANQGGVMTIISLGIILILPDLVIQTKKALGGSGGIFEQFANNFQSALSKGFTGGELLPGAALSDTRKLPFGGLSAQNIFRKTAVSGYAAGGAVVGGVTGGQEIPARAYKTFTGAGGRAALTLGDKELFQGAQQRIKDKEKKSA